MVEFTFTFAFLTVNALDSTSFFGQDEPTTRFMYFSLASLTTLGGGDLEPATSLAGLLSVTETVLGQIFLVTLVATLVGLFAAQRPRHDDPEAQSSES